MMQTNRRALLRGLRWLALGLVALLAIAVAMVELISWNFLKPMIAEQVEAATGRTFSIGGDLSLSLIPRPSVTARDMALGNPDWAATANMIEARRITLVPSIGAALTGSLAFSKIEAENPVVNLQQGPDGAANWKFRSAQQEQPTTAGAPGQMQIRIRQLEVTDGAIRYRSPATESPIVIVIPSLEASNDGETLLAEAAIVFREQPLRLQASADSLAALWEDDAPYAAQANLESGGSSLTASIELPAGTRLEEVEAQWNLDVKNLSRWSELAGGPPTDLDALRFAGRAQKSGSQWSLAEIEAQVGETRLMGQLAIDLGSDPFTIDGSLRSPELHAAKLWQVAPETEDEEPMGFAIPTLPRWQGAASLTIERLLWKQATARDIQAQLEFAPRRIELDSLQCEIGNGLITARASLVSGPDRATAEARIALEAVDLSAIELDFLKPKGYDGMIDGEVAAALEPIEPGARVEPSVALERLRIDRAELTYREDDRATRLEGKFTLSGQPPRPKLAISGQHRGRPIELELEGGPLPQLTHPSADYGIEAEATSGDFHARLATSLASLTRPQFGGDLAFRGNNGDDLERWLGRELPALPPFQFQGSLAIEDKTWSASAIEAQIGKSSFGGSVRFTDSERPVVMAAIDAERIDLAGLKEAMATTEAPHGGKSEGMQAPSGQGGQLAPLRSIDGQFDLRVETLALPNGRALRDIRLAADLADGTATVNLDQLKTGGGRASATLALNASEDPATGHLETEFEKIDLSELDETFLALQEKLGSMSGSARLNFTQTRAGQIDEDVLLPFLGRLSFDESRLRFENPKAGTDLTLRFQTAGLQDAEQRFEIEGAGKYDGSPFSLQFSGDPLIDARDPDRPYRLKLDATAVETGIALQGQVMRPLALQGLDLELSLDGPNPQRLSKLLGIPLPMLPPYSVSGGLFLKQDRWTFTNLEGRVGESDLNGSLALDAQQSPPKLQGELRSESLDFDDLGGLVGATPGAGPGETVSERQARRAAAADEDRFVLPDRDIVGPALENLSSDVRYEAKSVRVADIPLDDLAIDFHLQDGRMVFEPVSFGVGEGSVDLSISVDAKPQVPEGIFWAEVRSVDLRKALAESPIAGDTVGVVAGRGKIWVKGASVADMLGSADGGFMALMTQGKLDALLVELAGLDVGETLMTWLQDREKVDLHCAYADIQFRDGQARLDTFVVDTEDTTFTAGGYIDFDDERLDITLAAHPKDVSAPVGRTPLHLGGTFADIDTSLHGGQLAARLAGSAALAAANAPVTALLPLLDFGGQEGSNLCDGLIERTDEALEDVEAEP